MQKIISGSFLIAGTTIGGGMLALPLLTAKMGFFPGLLLMVVVWLVMYLSGLLVVQSVLWMERKVNFLHLASFYLGNFGKWITGGLFLFLYGSLIVAYFSGLGPLVNDLMKKTVGLNANPLLVTFLLATFFGFIVAFGMKGIDRVNAILFWGLIVSFILLLGFVLGHIQPDLLIKNDFSHFFSALPLLFTSFGYHNILPSVSYYLKKDARQIQQSILFGSLIALIVYSLWQLAMLGVIESETLKRFAQQNMPPTLALELALQNSMIEKIALFFSFFAITTSLLGVAFSLVDFLLDGLSWHNSGKPRYVIAFFVFAVPIVFASINPNVFVRALNVAGGYGESILNGILPVLFFYSGKKWMNKTPLLLNKWWPICLSLIMIVSCLAIIFEVFGN